MNVLRFEKWNEFREYIDNDRQAYPTYWRGQLDPDWPLASSFERQILNLNGGWKSTSSRLYPYSGRYKPDGENRLWDNGFYQEYRDDYLKRFKQACSGLRGSNPQELNNNQWWALGRHYGLITPLLDWTEKPYIAVFFALTELYLALSRNGGDLVFQGEDVAIYRLFHNYELEGGELKIIKVTVDELARVQSQRGLFTWLDSEDYFELQGFLDNTSRGHLLTQILLSDYALIDGLRDLRNHGIDYRLLFPDIAGAAIDANAKINIL